MGLSVRVLRSRLSVCLGLEEERSIEGHGRQVDKVADNATLIRKDRTLYSGPVQTWTRDLYLSFIVHAGISQISD